MTNQQGAPEALSPIARYKIGYATDDWGMRSSTPSGIPDSAGAWVRYEDHIAALVDAQQPAPSAAAVTEVENLRKALQFYADKDHFTIADDGAWDTVSGEPQNYWCDEEGTATVEDGTIARLALAGRQIKFDADDAPQPAPTPQADSQPAPQGEPWYGHHFKEVRRGYWQCSCGKVISEAASTASKSCHPSLPRRHTYDDDGEELFTADQMRAYVDADRDMRAKAVSIAHKATPVPVVEQEELREGASYESMNLAVMVLSDCGHSSNYKPLLERVAGRIDRHVERLLTAQQADRAMLAQAAPSAVAGPSDAVAYIDIGAGGYLDLGSDLSDEALRKLPKGRHMLAIVGTYGVDGYAPVAAPTTQPEQVAQGDALTTATR